MINEEDVFIPFVPSDLPEGPWLIFAPHADDETYGMGGTLIKASENGVETHLVVLTDGALGGEETNLVDTRTTEVKKASDALGISSLDCWMEEDRNLQVNEGLIRQVVKKILAVSPTAVFFPGPMEPHPDHRATSLLVWAALQKLNVKVRPKAYSYEISVQNPINLLIDISAQRAKKAVVMGIYSSQNSQNNYEDLVEALDKARTFSLSEGVNYAEGFYLYSENQLRGSLEDALLNIVARYLSKSDFRI
ncbi:PIG-L family deacetylase [Gammaproteobacteria bacterium]|nr:PIG-L family deacetylase [Gammaproteobacteria bacterium]